MNVRAARNNKHPPRRAVQGAAGDIAAQVLAAAAGVVNTVLEEGRTADDVMIQFEDHPQLRAIRAVALGTLRWWSRCDALITPLLTRSPQQTAPLLRALLCVAVHQLQHSRNPLESTVSAAVNAARLAGLTHAAGLVNAVLRRFLRERDALVAALESAPAPRYAHPQWLLDELRSAWPDCWEALLEANNAHPPLTLRLDLTRVSRDDYLRQLQEVGLEGQIVSWLPTAVIVTKPVAVERLPLFREGAVSVQDASAQLAARLLAPVDGERVLDACAAPGGKSGALLELAPELRLTALDCDAQRAQRVADNLRRLGRTAGLVVADLTAEPRWWDGVPFDAILLDAPCSATGVIRRHPEIKWLRREADIEALADQQRRMLQSCWSLLKPGGRLVYATCSVLPAENAAVVARFLAENSDAREVEPPAHEAPLRRADPGWQMLPLQEAGGDGFYYACLQRLEKG